MVKKPSRFNLQFDKDALKEFRRIDSSAQTLFKKKLAKLISGIELPSPRHAMYGFPKGFYKIKLRKAGLRMLYYYDDGKYVVLVIAVGKRERNSVYEIAKLRVEGHMNHL